MNTAPYYSEGLPSVDSFYAAVYDHYGYDFRNYSERIKQVRAMGCLLESGLESMAELERKVCDEHDFFLKVLSRLTITVTRLFRDPSFFLALKTQVLPVLGKQSHLKIWHPGCASGEELFSLVILLSEAGLIGDSVLYGTDINPEALRKARSGIVSAELIKASAANYLQCGGHYSLTRYFKVNHGFGLFAQSRRPNLVFSEHNLATDQSFGEMQLICCRNVLIYFNDDLRNRALGLISDSLSPGGFLCLGMHENLMFAAIEKDYELIDKRNKIYRKT